MYSFLDVIGSFNILAYSLVAWVPFCNCLGATSIFTLPAIILQPEKADELGPCFPLNKLVLLSQKKRKKSCTPYALKNGQITFLQRLMWVFFGLKYVKLSTFYILHIFATTDVVALSITIYKFHSLLLKKKKKLKTWSMNLLNYYLLFFE